MLNIKRSSIYELIRLVFLERLLEHNFCEAYWHVLEWNLCKLTNQNIWNITALWIGIIIIDH